MSTVFRLKIDRTLAVLLMSLLFSVNLFYTSCSGPKEDEIEAVGDRTKLPGLSVDKITTVISDSGVTRYRIAADKMEVFDRAKEPYWEFQKGVYFERFDEKMKVNANFRSDYAKYFERKSLWEFKGKVKAIDLEGKMLETELLYWDEKARRLYSEEFVKITLPNNIITGGMGFEADESMTWWRIKQVKGDMYYNEEEK